MTTTRRGDMVWIYPHAEHLVNQLGLILSVDGNDALVMMCHPDIRLTGHLDAVIDSSISGLPFSVGIFSHVVNWVPMSRVGLEPIGRIAEEQCIELEEARLGSVFKTLHPGRILADPSIELRWPLIEQIVMEFNDAVASTFQSQANVSDQKSFDDELFRVITEWQAGVITVEKRDEIFTACYELAILLEDSPETFICNEFHYMTADILGNRTTLAMSA